MLLEEVAQVVVPPLWGLGLGAGNPSFWVLCQSRLPVVWRAGIWVCLGHLSFMVMVLQVVSRTPRGPPQHGDSTHCLLQTLLELGLCYLLTVGFRLLPGPQSVTASHC